MYLATLPIFLMFVDVPNLLPLLDVQLMDPYVDFQEGLQPEMVEVLLFERQNPYLLFPATQPSERFGDSLLVEKMVSFH